ncbi:ribonucleoside-diphosphate reductase subunit alpha [bacterium]|nr:ribonucleoside-diphosphate reductase subunit alpha [bacterium]
MQVVKRNGSRENVSFDKVLQRIRKASRGLSVKADVLTQQVLARIVDGITTTELDELTAQMAAPLSTTHPDWGTLAARIAISNHHKNTSARFSDVVRVLSTQTMPKTGESISYVSKGLVDCVEKHGPEIDAYIKYERDYEFDYFGFKTLEKSYLLKNAVMKVVERPQHMWMRVALCLWAADLPKAFETYDMLSMKLFTHATPTLFNAGTPRQQLSSCFLLAMKDDSIDGIYDTLKNCAAISKHAGGIGLHVHNIRARGSLIRGTNGQSNGLVPMLQNFNATARYVDQGGGKRNGSFAIYLEPWHADVEDFLRLKLNSGQVEERARDLFYAMWIPDLFMQRVEDDAEWSLFCPSEAPGLADVWGPAFEAKYMDYEARGLARKRVSARKLWFQILDTQMETGTPYLLYKDAANAKSNQQNLGTIKSSNLCTEIIEFSSPDETAVCNLASIALPAFVIKKPSIGYIYDFEALRACVRIIVRNLNRVIDVNYYPTVETERSNMRHRPIGLGVQGLADVFAILQLSWESPAAAELNQLIFEHIYYAAVEESAAIAKVEGPYSSFAGSPISQGKLQPDLWGVEPLTSNVLNWTELREVASKGLRNSLLVAPMPTASTSQILGFNECFEPFTTNIYTRRVLAGEFTVVNKYLVKELLDMGIWSESMKQSIVAKNGSVQGIADIPQDMQNRYKTSWELPQKVLIDMAATRGAFLCQSQSLNLFMADPNYAKLTSMHFYAWKKGLKTGCYYLRTKAPVAAQKFTVDPRFMEALNQKSVDLSGVSSPEHSDESDTESVASKPETRQQKMERLVREYEEEVAKARASAEAGEGCLQCSS